MPAEAPSRFVVPVAIAPRRLERFAEVLDADAFARLMTVGERAAAALAGRVVWCVNSTATGGGVAEMLRSLLAYTRGAGVDCRWAVLRGDPSFFTVTKRLHNRLHGDAGDGGPIGKAERDAYELVTGAGARELAPLLHAGDVVVLHDPQTAGMVPLLQDTGAHVIWRAHVGADGANRYVDEATGFLLPYVEAADAWIFSRPRFIWRQLDPARASVVAPSIDVFSAKSQPLASGVVTAILRVAGLLGAGPTAAARFQREDGARGRVDRPAAILQDRPLRDDERYVLQLSRWDRLKDPLGVLDGYAASRRAWTAAHLVLAGPAADGVADDPEAAGVLAEVARARAALPEEVRARVHLASLPMADREENAAMANALQRRAAVVVQKSLAEGFGLTVTEAMWKGRPIVASRVGGIQDQLTDGCEGLTVEPRDLDAFGDAVGRLLADGPLAARLARSARARARAEFLEPRHLAQWADIVERVSRAPV